MKRITIAAVLAISAGSIAQYKTYGRWESYQAGQTVVSVLNDETANFYWPGDDDSGYGIHAMHLPPIYYVGEEPIPSAGKILFWGYRFNDRTGSNAKVKAAMFSRPIYANQMTVGGAKSLVASTKA